MRSATNKVYRGVTWRNHGPFCLPLAGEILPTCPACPQTCPYGLRQLEKLLDYPSPFPGRPPKHDRSTWTVTDDWPEHVPITEAEVEVFERWFGDFFDELFGSAS